MPFDVEVTHRKNGEVLWRNQGTFQNFQEMMAAYPGLVPNLHLESPKDLVITQPRRVNQVLHFNEEGWYLVHNQYEGIYELKIRFY